MGRNLMPEVIRLHLFSGCHVVRHGKGDHDIWESPISAHRFPIDAKILSRRMANTVLKQAGLPKHF